LDNLYFHNKNVQADARDIDHEIAILQSMVTLLDSNPTIHHKTVRQAFEAKGTTEEHMRRCFGRYLKPSSSGMSDVEIELTKRMRQRQAEARTAEIRYRLETELVDCVKEGWFVIFQTLTVAPAYYSEVFKEGSKAWTRYIQRVERAIGQSIYGTQRAAEEARKKGKRFHKYFAVVERGTVGKRLHIHVVHMCQALPEGCKIDPNRNVNVPYRACVRNWHFWEYGHQMPIAVRFEAFDAFTRIGWRWPVIKDKSGNYKPREAKPAVALARYVSKYVGS
jgi:hypothetical protein